MGAMIDDTILLLIAVACWLLLLIGAGLIGFIVEKILNAKDSHERAR